MGLDIYAGTLTHDKRMNAYLPPILFLSIF